MANVRKTIEIIFQGVDNVSASISDISDSLSAFGGKVEAIAEPFSKLADGVLATDAALLALAAGGLTYAFSKSKEFENALIELKKVTDGNQESVETARLNALALSDQYGESSTRILDSTSSFIQAGYNIEEAMGLTKSSMDLVIAGGLEASQSSELLIATLKGFDAPATDAARVIDILNSVSNKYATDVEQLARGMSKIAPIAQLMGFSFEETAGLLTPVIEVFRSGDEAAVALKTGLLKLIDDAKPVKDALAAIGVSQTDLNGKLRSGKDVLLDVAEAFKTADENDKLFLTSQLVGLEQSARMVTVFDNLAKYTGIVGVALNSAGSAAAEVALRLESAEIAVNRFTTGFENLGIAIGDEFRVAAVGAINGMTDIENAIREGVTSGAFEPLFTLISDFANEAGFLFRDIAKALPEAFLKLDYTGIGESFSAIRETISGLFDGLDLGDPDDLAVAMQKVIDTIEALIRVTDGMIEGFKPFFDAIGQAITEVNSLDDETAKAFGQLLASAKLVTDAGVAIAGAFFAIQQSGAQMSSVFDLVIGAITTVWNTAQFAFSAIASTIVDTVAAILTGVNVLFEGIPDIAVELVPGLKGFKEGLRDVTQEVQAYGRAIKEDATNQFKEGIGGAARALSVFTGGAKDAAESADTLKNAVNGVPTDKVLTLDVSVSDEFLEIPETIDAIPLEKTIVFSADGTQLTDTYDALTDLDGTELEFIITADDEALIKAEAEIDILANRPYEINLETSLGIEDAKERLEDLKRAAATLKNDLQFQSAVSVSDREDLTSLERQAEELEKALKIKAKVDKSDAVKEIDRMKLRAKALDSAFEYKAKVDVAEIEAAAAVTQAAFESIGQGLASSGDIFGSLAGAYATARYGSQRDFLERQMREESDRREEQLELQRDLIEQQIAYYEAKREAAERGQALIEVNGTGLQPHLEAIMWEVLAAIQVRANEEGQAALLGLSL